jgi:flavin-binding protein dodecin
LFAFVEIIGQTSVSEVLQIQKQGRKTMSVAKNIEISSTSNTSFEDAIKKGISRATNSLDNVRSAWIKEQKVKIDGGNVSQYEVMMIITFVLDGNDSDDNDGKGSGKSKSKKR